MLRRTFVRAAGVAAATAALGACTTERAAFSVAVRDLSLNRGGDRPLPTRVWCPTAPGPFPLIHFSHGLTTDPAHYADLLEFWARAGFVVAAPAYPHTSHGVADYDPGDIVNQSTDAAYVITQTLSALGRLIAPGRIAAAGHSAGAVTTIDQFSGNRDNRLVAGVVLAGEVFSAAPYAGPSAPLFFVHGKRDRTVSYQSGRYAYEKSPWPKALLTITDGDHEYTRTTFGVYASTTTDFWRWSLNQDRAAAARLGTDATAGHLATLEDHLS